eukprot:384710-Pyramimonas_sp.AAC.1
MEQRTVLTYLSSFFNGMLEMDPTQARVVEAFKALALVGVVEGSVELVINGKPKKIDSLSELRLAMKAEFHRVT